MISIYSALPAEIVCTGTIDRSKAVSFLFYIPKFSYASDFNILFSFGTFLDMQIFYAD